MRYFVALFADHTSGFGGNQLVWGVSVGGDIAGAVQCAAALTGP